MSAEAHKLTGHGDFVHVAGAMVERLQVALVRRADLDRLPRVEAVPGVKEALRLRPNVLDEQFHL